MNEYKYRESHEWVKFEDETTALIGISSYAQESLGDIVFVNLPSVGDAVTAGETFADVESVKAVWSPRSTKRFATGRKPSTKIPWAPGLSRLKRLRKPKS